ncbi:hypothetical protein CEE37_05530 [candidate division LCP-89 bacterium B3_LCP]|uniref:VanZ-like domain-containing protein n=1 Tax=candidate division LCP-89 bacterium B3_LCP TaxID=2012998 RepID=A0A532V1P5_UNCL8|nr:MAG: hypothetical protein CEE37_05530 [candidate division LCP-89 bacterium B3_LCP]
MMKTIFCCLLASLLLSTTSSAQTGLVLYKQTDNSCAILHESFSLINRTISLNRYQQSQSEVDSWTSCDKFYHLFASAFISGMGLWALESTHNDPQQSMISSFGITVGLGGAKEIYDSHHPHRQASWKDLIVDAIGAALGVLVVHAL